MQLQYKPWHERVKGFPPSWFAASMGVGVQTALLHSFPYNGKHQAVLDGFGTAFLIMNIVLFLVLSLFAVTRLIKYPDTWNKVTRDPIQSHFIGTCPCALSTIVNGLALEAYQNYHIAGTGFLYFIWGLWWLNVVMAAWVNFGLFHHMIVTHTYTAASPSAIWLLPIIPSVVAGASGSIVATVMIRVSPHYALLTTLVSTGLIVIGCTMTIFILVLYTQRLIMQGFPTSRLAVSVFIPIGPLGQSGWGLLYISDLLPRLLPYATSSNDYLAASGVATVLSAGCLATAVVLWFFGIWFLVPAATQLAYSKHIPFGIPWWGLIFPMGVYSLLTVNLGNKLNSGPLRCLGAIYILATFVTFTAVSIRTIVMLYKETVYYSPCREEDEEAFLPGVHAAGNPLSPEDAAESPSRIV